VNLLHGTSILYFQAVIANPVVTEPDFGLNLYSLPGALIESGPDFFRRDSIAARTCLSMIPDASDVLKILLEKGQTTKAGRLAGAFRNIGSNTIADQIVATMKGLGYDIREEDPFLDKIAVPFTRAASPCVTRLKLMWDKMRGVVIGNFPRSGNVFTDVDACMRHIEAKYEQDAYEELVKNAPKTDSYVETPDGRGTITEINLLRQKAKVRLETPGGDLSVSYYPLEEIQFIKTGKQRRAEVIAEAKEREANGERPGMSFRRNLSDKPTPHPAAPKPDRPPKDRKPQIKAEPAPRPSTEGEEAPKKPRRRRRRRSGNGGSSDAPKAE
jgi:hypothetical protein